MNDAWIFGDRSFVARVAGGILKSNQKEIKGHLSAPFLFFKYTGMR
jgi:hypothetical protein